MPGHVRQMHPAKSPVVFQSHAPGVPMCHNMRWRLIGTNAIDDPVPRAQTHVSQTRFPGAVMQRNHKVYVTPKPGGGCEANAHLDKHEELNDMVPLASMPGGPEDMGPLATMPGGPDEIAMLAGDSGHSAVALAFRLTVLLHNSFLGRRPGTICLLDSL